MKKSKIYILILFMCLSIVLIGCKKVQVENNDGVIINEICTNNGKSLATNEYKYIDWIELYNTTDEDIMLKDYGISDDKADYYKYKLPEVYIKAKDYLIIFFDKDGSSEELCGDFSLSEKGEKIYFTMPNGTVLESINVPALKLDVTFGRYEKNGEVKFQMTNPTPGVINDSKPLYKYIENPNFSAEAGFYDDPFNLQLTTNQDVKIYYTLDCSVPTEDSILYSAPIYVDDPSSNPNVLKSRSDLSIFASETVKNPVDKMFIVRAIAISSDGNKSEIVTKNYFVGKSKYKNGKIVSLVTDSDNLVNPTDGILIKGQAYQDYIDNGSEGTAPKYNWDADGRKSERDCNLSYLSDGDLVMNQDCGMRIHGYGGRSIMYKSFNIYARSNYGEKYFSDSIFDESNQTKSFILKYDRYSKSAERFKDGFIQSLVKERNLATQQYEQCILFINGEYWHTYSIMQKYTEEYIEDTYGINEEEAIIVKDGALEAGKDEDFLIYESLTRFVKTSSMADSKNYEKFCNMVDVQSLIDFYTVQLYTNNFDFSNRKNYLLWRTRSDTGEGYSDGKWRYMLYDLDYVAVDRVLEYKGNRAEYNYKFNTFTGIFLYATDFKDDIFMKTLIKNPSFKEQFAISFLDIANYYLSGDNVYKHAYEEYKYTSGEMMTFFDNRFDYIKEYLADYLGVSNEYKTVRVETTKLLKFNTLNLTENYSGKYLTVYPIILKDVDVSKLVLTDLTITSNDNGVVRLQITGSNPSIKYN